MLYNDRAPQATQPQHSTSPSICHKYCIILRHYMPHTTAPACNITNLYRHAAPTCSMTHDQCIVLLQHPYNSRQLSGWTCRLGNRDGCKTEDASGTVPKTQKHDVDRAACNATTMQCCSNATSTNNGPKMQLQLRHHWRHGCASSTST